MRGTKLALVGRMKWITLLGVLLCGACAPAHATQQTQRDVAMINAGADRTCEAAVARAGHLAGYQYCTDDIDFFCADALMRADYELTSLAYCRGVQGMCAASLINDGVPARQIATRCRTQGQMNHGRYRAQTSSDEP